MRLLTNFEIENTIYFAKKRIDYTLIEPTKTGLEKSIMDATASVRLFLKDNELHDYELQKQGQSHKVIIKAYLLNNEEIIDTNVSLYRPLTKKGDPRIWIRKLKNYVRPNDILSLINYNNNLICINISKISLSLLASINALFEDVLSDMSYDSSIANELFFKLKKIAKNGPYRGELNDTSIGFLLESLLGISRNCNEQPDYKGIEIKSHRAYDNVTRQNRVNLFAKVADWELSNLKSSREILEAFGYERDNILKLYCTVSTQTFNSQGLRFRINEDKNWLEEFCNDNNIKDVAVWTLKRLHEKLLIKHNETFWVSARNKKNIKLGYEEFWYTEVVHTQKPITAQFDLLLSQGQITMDHLIKKNKQNKVSERGPLFKIDPKYLDRLFPIIEKKSLLD